MVKARLSKRVDCLSPDSVNSTRKEVAFLRRAEIPSTTYSCPSVRAVIPRSAVGSERAPRVHADTHTRSPSFSAVDDACSRTTMAAPFWTRTGVYGEERLSICVILPRRPYPVPVSAEKPCTLPDIPPTRSIAWEARRDGRSDDRAGKPWSGDGLDRGGSADRTVSAHGRAHRSATSPAQHGSCASGDPAQRASGGAVRPATRSVPPAVGGAQGLDSRWLPPAWPR